MPDRAKWMIYGANGYIGRNAINRLFFRII
jgi:short subunit dehydrogenase-like uncharacterized protein